MHLVAMLLVSTCPLAMSSRANTTPHDADWEPANAGRAKQWVIMPGANSFTSNIISNMEFIILIRLETHTSQSYAPSYP